MILLFPSGGHFPFSMVELLPVIAFCVVGFAATWRLEQGKPLAGFFAVYLLASLASFAVRNGGVFPSERVRRIIDGRDVAAHGNFEMPVWGDAFKRTTSGWA